MVRFALCIVIFFTMMRLMQMRNISRIFGAGRLSASVLAWLMIGIICLGIAACGGGGGTSGNGSAAVVPPLAQDQPAGNGTPDVPQTSGDQSAAGLSLIAGDIGGVGSIDGIAGAARFNDPQALTVDAAGNIFIADTSNHTIRKLTPAGVVTTVAGRAGAYGSADGNGSAARFSSPSGIAADAAGNLFIADTGNGIVRKITPAGDVSTLAGTPGLFGSADGSGAAAQFQSPFGIKADAAGNLFVTDTDNLTIRKITPAGVVTTLAGTASASGSIDGTGAAARFTGPHGITLDASGNIYITDTFHFPQSLGSSNNSTIRKITAAGVVTTLAGMPGVLGSADGTGAAAQFNYPGGIAADAGGNLYVADTNNGIIRKVTPAGAVSTFAGTVGGGSVDGNGSSARFFNPGGIATDAAGNLYVADTSNSTIRKVTPAADVSTLAGAALKSGSTDGPGTSARFAGPHGIAADSAGNLYVADTYNSVIRKITPAGLVSTFAGTAGSGGYADGSGAAAQFSGPQGVAADAAGNLYVADTGNNMIRKITPAGVVTTLAGSAMEGSADGTGSAAQFRSPSGIAVDASGNVYVADTNNDAIRKISPAGMVTTLAGSAQMEGNADGTGADARFHAPGGITLDSSGNLYVTDTYNHTIRKITAAGIVMTLAGTPGNAGSADGSGAAARFFYPQGIVVDTAGNLYVADTLNDTVRKITPAGDVSTIAGVAGQQGISLGALPGSLSLPIGIALTGQNTLALTSSFSVLEFKI